MPYELMRKIYRLDTQKMKGRGEVRDIAEIVAGLDSTMSEWKPSALADKIAEALAERLDRELVRDEYSTGEQVVLDNLIPIVSSQKWISKAQR